MTDKTTIWLVAFLILITGLGTFFATKYFLVSDSQTKRNELIESKIDTLNSNISYYKSEIEKLNALILANDIGLNAETKIYNYKVTQIKQQSTSEDVKRIKYYAQKYINSDTLTVIY